MKREFTILKDRPKVTVSVTRDSVCMGDDYEAPHEKKIEIYSFTDPEAFATALASGYLPRVAGFGHSWTCSLNGVRIGVIYTSEFQPLVRETPIGAENTAHFSYRSAKF